MTVTPPRDDRSLWEHAARAFELRAPDPIREAADVDSWRTPGTLAARLMPSTVQTPALDLIDLELQRLVDTPDGRLIVTMPPQEGKSTRVAKDFIIWLLKHRPWLRVVGASYAQGLANRNGRAVRNLIRSNPDLGLTLAKDNGAASEWEIEGRGGGMLSVGRGAGVTGRTADLLVIDDPLKDRQEADSEIIRDACWDWWTDSLSTRLTPGAPVVLILTRWHEDDLAGRLLAAEDGHLWRVVRIPAQADHDPSKGETDPLGRAPGDFLESARGRTPEQWQAIRTRVGERTWNALYQGRPTSAAGTVFRRERWRYYDQPLWVERTDGARIVSAYDDLLISWDLTFKGTTTNRTGKGVRDTDYVAGQVWMRRGADAFLLDQVHARMDFPETCRQLRAMAARWPQAVLKLVEDKANGPAVIAALSRTVPGIVPVEPDGGKEARAAAVSPLVEAGNVWLPAPELLPWVDGLVEEAAAFPTGAHDDRVDAMTQALNRLILQPLLAGHELVEYADLDDDLAGFGSYVP